MGQSPLLRTYRTLKEGNKLKLERYLSVPHGGWNDRVRMGRRELTRLRSGTHGLEIHLGRFEEVPADQRLCLLCGDGVEDERHLLVQCVYFDDRRKNLYIEIERIINSEMDVNQRGRSKFTMAGLSEDERFHMMMGVGHRRTKGEELYNKVMNKILIEIQSWLTVREEVRNHIVEMRKSSAGDVSQMVISVG